MERNPYRSSLSTVTPRSVSELFGYARDLEADDTLRMTYSVLPWKRIIVTVHVRPEPTLPAYLERLSRTRGVEIFVEESDGLAYARFRVVRSRLAQDGEGPTESLEALSGVSRGRIRVDGRILFAFGGGALRFFVSSYEPDELAARFERAFPWAKLELPPLVGRAWFMRL